MRLLFFVCVFMFFSSQSFSQSRVGVGDYGHLNSYRENMLSNSLGDYDAVVSFNYFGDFDLMNMNVEIIYENVFFTDSYKNNYKFRNIIFGLGPSFEILKNLSFEAGIYIRFSNLSNFEKNETNHNLVTKNSVNPVNFLVYNRITYYHNIYEKFGAKISLIHMNPLTGYLNHPHAPVVNETNILRLYLGVEYEL